MLGTPRASRSTVTSADRPGSSRAPESSGRGGAPRWPPRRRPRRRPVQAPPRRRGGRATHGFEARSETNGSPSTRGVAGRRQACGPGLRACGRPGAYHWHSDGPSARRSVLEILDRTRRPGGTVPTYSYVCTVCDHRFDAQQSFADGALTECPECEGRLRKLFGNVGVVFKGPGFYRTDARAMALSLIHI